MLTKNVGKTDRNLRAAAGFLGIIGFFAFSGGFAWLLLVVGIVLLGTAATSYCPPYHLLGISTCKHDT